MAKDLFEKNKLMVLVAAVVVVALIAVGAGLLLSGGSGGNDGGYETPAEDVGNNVIRYNYEITFDDSFTSKDGVKIEADVDSKFAFFEYRLINSSVEAGISTHSVNFGCNMDVDGTYYYVKHLEDHPDYTGAVSLNQGKSYTSTFVYEVPTSAEKNDFSPSFTYTLLTDIEFKLDEDITV